MASSITRIRVPARFQIDDAGPTVAVATFALGMGPCGREVTALSLDADTAMLSIVQRHADGSTVAFLYPLAQITGRVEVTNA